MSPTRSSSESDCSQNRETEFGAPPESASACYRRASSPGWGWKRPGSCRRHLPHRPRPGRPAQGWGRGGSCPEGSSRLGNRKDLDTNATLSNASPDGGVFEKIFSSGLARLAEGRPWKKRASAKQNRHQRLIEDLEPRQHGEAGIAALKTIMKDKGQAKKKKKVLFPLEQMRDRNILEPALGTVQHSLFFLFNDA